MEAPRIIVRRRITNTNQLLDLPLFSRRIATLGFFCFYFPYLHHFPLTSVLFTSRDRDVA